ncbi:hypothetical protein EMPS_04182 [Entomortierella parvispora]|uniref:RRM domain-containing protein n=1 Tax=Entomortierella parvispora TaxID=205924 RepID=A0A9P3H880_9FUNG|nr:hypothetical protein EMPS_04182 [Entomortierella parvispora]
MPRDRSDNSVSLYVSGFKDNIRPSDLAVLFEPHGKIADVYIPKDYYTGNPRGFAYIQYHDDEDARRVFESGEKFTLDGRKLDLQYAQGRRKSPNQMRGGGGRGGDRERGGGRRRSRSPDRYRPSSRRYSRSRSPSGDRRARRRDSRSPVRRGGRSRSRSPPRRRSPSPRRRSPSPRRRPSRSRSPIGSRGRSGSRDVRRRGSISRSPPRHDGGGRYSATPERERNMSTGEQGEIMEQGEFGGQ